jgi:hypothetical protein
MRNSRFSATLAAIFALLVVVLAASPACRAQFVYFDGSTSTDFHDATNWTPESAPGTNLVDIYGIDDGLSATFSGGSTTVVGLRVGSAAKEHQFPSQETRFGRLTMTDGLLEVIGENTLVVGRERENAIFGGDYNKNSIVDAADYTVWRDTLGSMSDLRADGDQNGTIEPADYDYWKARFGNRVKGGEIILTGTSTVTANGAIIGERTNGLLSVGPDSVVELRDWVTNDGEPHFGGTQDMRIGNYGPAYFQFIEPGLDGRGLVDLQGTLNASAMYLSENGAKGEIRLSGGTVNLNGALIMDFCGGCVSPGTPANDAKLALRSAKVTIVGSGGSFNVGLDPDPLLVDPAPPDRDLLAASPTAKFSFTADAGGVTPIVLPENIGETSGTAFVSGSLLELNLDAYTGTGPLTLINAAPGNLSGMFGAVVFTGSRTATVNYDVANGDVTLTNFLGGGGALVATTVPEPSSAVMLATVGFFLLSIGAGTARHRARRWGYQCLSIRS